MAQVEGLMGDDNKTNNFQD